MAARVCMCVCRSCSHLRQHESLSLAGFARLSVRCRAVHLIPRRCRFMQLKHTQTHTHTERSTASVAATPPSLPLNRGNFMVCLLCYKSGDRSIDRHTGKLS